MVAWNLVHDWLRELWVLVVLWSAMFAGAVASGCYDASGGSWGEICVNFTSVALSLGSLADRWIGDGL